MVVGEQKVLTWSSKRERERETFNRKEESEGLKWISESFRVHVCVDFVYDSHSSQSSCPSDVWCVREEGGARQESLVVIWTSGKRRGRGRSHLVGHIPYLVLVSLGFFIIVISTLSTSLVYDYYNCCGEDEDELARNEMKSVRRTRNRFSYEV